jgi:chemotaxis protein CheZ
MEIQALKRELRDLQKAVVLHHSPSPAPAEGNELSARLEVAHMVRILSQAKEEIAAIKHPLASDDRIQLATGHLDEIIMATEDSTESILAAAERIESQMREMGNLHPDDVAVATIGEKVADDVIKIFEACNFQDITGQRVTKVVHTMRFIEERIRALIGIWGREAFTNLPLPTETDDAEDQQLMNGPQLSGEAISQSEVDALFD